MKIGLKIYNKGDLDKIKPVLDRIDFLEVMAIEGRDYSFLKKVKLPIVVHCMHQRWGINPANAMKFSKNRRVLNFAISLADEYDAKFIVIHPGHKEKGFCAAKNASHFLSNFNDERILIENLPRVDEGYSEMYGAGFGGLQDMIEIADKDFCLDLEHAGITANDKKRDIVEFIMELMKLKPKYFHICDVKFGKKMKNHLALGKGDLPLREIKKLIPDNAWVLLETEHNIDEHKEDIEFLRK